LRLAALCIGKGNEDWNFSAPHGAGRLMSRTAAKNSFTVSEFKKQMKDVFTTSVNKDTLDECPMAYKDMLRSVEQFNTDFPIQNINTVAEINKKKVDDIDISQLCKKKRYNTRITRCVL
jgi:RNA-splicing ligase RtcB